MSHPFSFQRLPRSFAIPTLVLFGFVLAAGSAAAQVVTFEPAFPSVDEPVTVYFHADEGTGGLAGYTGDVYAHTGVITDRSTTPGDWKYVKTSWGQNTPDTKLERIGTDLYRLVISDIRTYYGIPSSEQVLKLAFVFRSGAQVGGAYLEGKGDQNTDIFITLYESGVNVRIAEPATDALNPLIADRDTTVDVMAVAGSVGSPLAGLKLLVNGAPVSETANDTLVYSLALTSPGRVDVTAIAISDGGASDTAAFYAVRNPDQAEAALPAGIQDGINYDPGDPTKVTLSLYAPGKDFVYVVGDFSDWEVDPAYLMNRDEVRADSVRYWITLDGLEPGREYAFQYLVDGMLRMADLFSPKVLVPGDDASIGAATYPDLKPYPQGKTTGTVSVFRTGQEPFAFTAFARP
ncbi:MAG TPA: alpha-amylase, partial [Rhodothermales bacterium]|nr:alpha-amylase [Rhodothermales bacterium]